MVVGLNKSLRFKLSRRRGFGKGKCIKFAFDYDMNFECKLAGSVVSKSALAYTLRQGLT